MTPHTFALHSQSKTNCIQKANEYGETTNNAHDKQITQVNWNCSLYMPLTQQIKVMYIFVMSISVDCIIPIQCSWSQYSWALNAQMPKKPKKILNPKPVIASVTITNYDHFSFIYLLWLLYKWITKFCKVLWFDSYPRWFSWVKRHPIDKATWMHIWTYTIHTQTVWDYLLTTLRYGPWSGWTSKALLYYDFFLKTNWKANGMNISGFSQQVMIVKLSTSPIQIQSILVHLSII